MKYTQSSLLVVDDDEMNRDMLCRRLQRHGYTVAAAPGGAVALAMMEVERYDLVLLDIMMPEMDGYSVLEQIKASTRLRHTAVIMLTADNSGQSVLRCIELGANDYVVKPFELAMLQSRIARALEKSRWQAVRDATGLAPADTDFHVLVVEDDPMGRDLVVSRLRSAGYVVSYAGEGREALEMLRQRRYDLVLLDIVMPGFDGFDVLKKLKSDPELGGTPVLMLSALADEETIEKCLQGGAVDYLTKPFHPLVLKSRVSSCLLGSRSPV